MDLTLTISLGLLVGCLIAISWFAGSDAPYVPTYMNQITDALKKAGVKKGKKFYELGSGDGRVVLEAARLGADAFGIEQSWLRILYSKYQAKKQKLPNAHFSHGNIFAKNYNDADIVYAYLLQTAIDKLELKLKKELKPGSVVITQTYHFKNWKPFLKIPTIGLAKKPTELWLYRR